MEVIMCLRLVILNMLSKLCCLWLIAGRFISFGKNRHLFAASSIFAFGERGTAVGGHVDDPRLFLTISQYWALTSIPNSTTDGDLTKVY